MTNKEVVIEKDDCIVQVGVSTSESFNFVSGMEGCMNRIAYVKVNGIDIHPQGVFEFIDLEGLNALLDNV
jgi:hypothetical protein